MQLRDLAKQKGWMFGPPLIGAVGSLAYFCGPQPVIARSFLGMVFGLIGLGLMVFVTLLWVNRFCDKGWLLFKRSTWLRGHVWLAFLSVWFVVLHTSLHRGGTLELALWVLLIVTVATGLWGLAVQQVVPNMMTVDGEVPYVQLTHICEAMRHDADDLMERVCGTELLNRAACASLPENGEARTATVETAHAETPPAGSSSAGAANTAAAGSETSKSEQADATTVVLGPRVNSEQTATAHRVACFYVRRVRPFLDPQHRADPASSSRKLARADFDQMRSMHLTAEMNEALDTLERHYRHRTQLARQARLHFWLHGWLIVHVPVSLGLMALSILHAVASLYY